MYPYQMKSISKERIIINQVIFEWLAHLLIKCWRYENKFQRKIGRCRCDWLLTMQLPLIKIPENGENINFG